MAGFGGAVLIFLIGCALPAVGWGYAVGRWFSGRVPILVVIFGLLPVVWLAQIVMVLISTAVNDLIVGSYDLITVARTVHIVTLWILASLWFLFLPLSILAAGWGYSAGRGPSLRRIAGEASR